MISALSQVVAVHELTAAPSPAGRAGTGPAHARTPARDEDGFEAQEAVRAGDAIWRDVEEHCSEGVVTTNVHALLLGRK